MKLRVSTPMPSSSSEKKTVSFSGDNTTHVFDRARRTREETVITPVEDFDLDKFTDFAGTEDFWKDCSLLRGRAVAKKQNPLPKFLNKDVFWSGINMMQSEVSWSCVIIIFAL